MCCSLFMCEPFSRLVNIRILGDIDAISAESIGHGIVNGEHDEEQPKADPLRDMKTSERKSEDDATTMNY